LPRCAPDAMPTEHTTHPTAARKRITRTIRHLHELIAALDRRAPQAERSGEASIARAAAALRAETMKRIADLEQEAAAVPVHTNEG
jgi:phage shock protein A